jgi:hypothetical protein
MQRKKNKEFNEKSEYQKRLIEFNSAVIAQSERFRKADNNQIIKDAPAPHTPRDTKPEKKTSKQSIYAL